MVTVNTLGYEIEGRGGWIKRPNADVQSPSNQFLHRKARVFVIHAFEIDLGDETNVGEDLPETPLKRQRVGVSRPDRRFSWLIPVRC